MWEPEGKAKARREEPNAWHKADLLYYTEIEKVSKSMAEKTMILFRSKREANGLQARINPKENLVEVSDEVKVCLFGKNSCLQSSGVSSCLTLTLHGCCLNT